MKNNEGCGQTNIIKREFTYPSSDGRTMIHAIEWKPEGEVRAVLQILHGMVEYVDRYDGFASFLAEKGFAVTGNDHLGHGASVVSDEDHGFFAQPDGNKCVITDIDTLRGITRENYPDVPYFMLGHSMGSFLLRQYITTSAAGLSGVVIMGTGSQPGAVLIAGKFLCRLTAAFRGWRYRSRFIDNLALGSYNKSIKEPRTKNDWLSANEENVDEYCADPWCSFMFTVNGYFNLFTAISIAQKDAGKVPAELGMYVVSGKDDAVGGSGEGVEKAFISYKKAGVKDLTMKLYEGYRHELLRETAKEDVYSDLYEWMTERM